MKWTTIFKPLLFLGTIFSTNAKSSDWRAISGALTYKNETYYQLKGVNWFGFETCDFVVHGLWVHPMTWYLDFLQQYNFNVIRVPFSQKWVLHSFENQYPSTWSVSADPSVQGKTSLEILDMLFEECRKRGIFILLDMHRLNCDAQSHELWYSIDSNEYTSETFFESWQKMIDRYAHLSNFHGIDLLNEPRGLAEWGNDPSTSWNLFVESAFKRLQYDGIIYSEGTSWGRTFERMRDHPIRVDDPTRIVFSPHVYGPSVVGNMDLDPFRLHAEWNRIFGFLVSDKKTVSIGEWGGRFVGADAIWQNLFCDYLISLRVSGLYWALNSNSGDTGGLLDDDWTTPKYDKLELLDRLQPYPTIVRIDDTNNTYTRHKNLRSLVNNIN